MEFLKKNYEKIILGLVLAGLMGALFFLPFYIADDKQKMTEKLEVLVNPPHVLALTNLDMSAESNIVDRLESPLVLDLETTNKLFNPLEWQKSLDGRLIKKDTSTGAKNAIVTGIVPLYLTLSLESIMTNELGARYVVGIERQAATTPYKRKKSQRYVSAGDKPNETFGFIEVKGLADNPEALVLKMIDSGELVKLSREKPFRRVDAYAVDFRYDPEKKVFKGCRAGDRVSFNGNDYLISDVNQNELILLDQSNQKKTTLPFKP